ncbi:MAG: hypothetical protein H6631_03515 [Anaerolineaceae bacterium]|nr:hypothetical protein [Anaerolineaceae bacterium]
MTIDQKERLKPEYEQVGIDPAFNWTLPLRPQKAPAKKIKSVWYLALPISSAHRRSNKSYMKGGVDTGDDLLKYRNYGCVYPHSALVEMITYHQMCFPEIAWRYIDVDHEDWAELCQQIRENPPDVAAFTVYTATSIWAFIVAAEIKKANPNCIIVFGNDHASLLHEEILKGEYGTRLVDFIGLGNNGPFTMMGLLYALQGQLEWEKVPSLAYRYNGGIKTQNADTYPLSHRRLPNYGLIEGYMVENYDKTFRAWYSHHYELQRMITMSIDGGCNWGKDPNRRCKHCSIVGLTPKTSTMAKIIPALEHAVGELKSNVYAAGDSTFGFSSTQWKGESDYLDQLAEACANSPILNRHRFMLMYGLVREFIAAADLCKGFVRSWSVGVESFDTKILKNNSKGVNKDRDLIYEALELAKSLDYHLHASGILGLPGTTLETLKKEVESWLVFTELYQDNVTHVTVALPAIIPGSRMYWESYQQIPEVRKWHGELIPARRLSELYIKNFTQVKIEDVEAAIVDLGNGVRAIAENGKNPVRFGGFMMGGIDGYENQERKLLAKTVAEIR